VGALVAVMSSPSLVRGCSSSASSTLILPDCTRAASKRLVKKRWSM
jgi:hypothetical protein